MKDDVTFSIGFEVDEKAADKILSRSRRIQRKIKREGLESVGINPFNFSTQGIPQGKPYRPIDFVMLSKPIEMFTKKLLALPDIPKGLVTVPFTLKGKPYGHNDFIMENGSYKRKQLPSPDWMYPTVIPPENAFSKFRRLYEEQLASEERLKHVGDGNVFTVYDQFNEFEDKNFSSFQLKKKMADMKKAFYFAQSYGQRNNFTYSDELGIQHNALGMNESVREYTKAEQALKALKESDKVHKQITQEKKKQNREENAHNNNLVRTLGTLYLIRKVIEGIGKLWKGLVGTNVGILTTDYKETGFFSANAYGATNANVNKGRAVLSRGLDNMGKAAPFSIGDFDARMKALQDLRLKAMSGQGISDEQGVISLQRLSDTLGLGYNIERLLTNPNIDLTDLLMNIMDSVEKFMPKLDKLDDIKKSLVTNDILSVLGDTIANALSSHANYNMRTRETETLTSQITTKGTDSLELYDFTKNAKAFSDALAETIGPLNTFKKNIADIFSPFATEVLKGTSFVAGRINNIFDMTRFSGYGGDLHNGKLVYKEDNEDKKRSSKYWKENEKSITQLLKQGVVSEESALFNLAYNPDTKDLTESRVEYVAQELMLDHIFQVMEKSGGTINSAIIEADSMKNLFTDKEMEFARELYSYFGDRNGKPWGSYEEFKKAYFRSNFPREKLFGEGKEFDYSSGKSISEYLQSVVPQNMYVPFIGSLFQDGSPLYSQGYKAKELTTDINKDGKSEGYYTLRIELPNNKNLDIPLTSFTESAVKTISLETN